jgi:hypothetical protein
MALRFKRTELRSCAFALLWLGMSACTTWRTRGTGLLNVSPLPAEVRVMLRNGSNVVVRTPAVAADTLKGKVDGREIGFLVQNIANVQVRRVSWMKTSILTVVVAAPVAFVVWFIQCDCFRPAT